VVVLRFVVGMTIIEVARSLNKCKDAVRGLQRRGLSAFKESLSKLDASYA